MKVGSLLILSGWRIPLWVLWLCRPKVQIRPLLLRSVRTSVIRIRRLSNLLFIALWALVIQWFMKLFRIYLKLIERNITTVKICMSGFGSSKTGVLGSE